MSILIENRQEHVKSYLGLRMPDSECTEDETSLPRDGILVRKRLQSSILNSVPPFAPGVFHTIRTEFLLFLLQKQAFMTSLSRESKPTVEGSTEFL